MKQRKDGRYCKQILIGYQTNGRPKYKNIYGYSKTEVTQQASLFKAELEKGIAIIEDDITLKVWSERWLKLYKRNTSYNTQEMYKGIVNNHILPYLGHLKLKSIKTHHIQEIINSLLNEGKERTASQVKLTINQILKQAIQNEYIYKNVAEGIILPTMSKPKKRALTDKEKKYISKTNFSDMEKAFLYILLYTGVRRGEALSLSKKDIDFKNNVIHINKNLIFKGNDSEIKSSPKSNAGNRDIPILDELKPILKSYIKHLDSLYLFHMQNGNIMSKSSFRKFWDNIMDKLNTTAGGVNYIKKKEKPQIIAISKEITPHMFRHTYATMLYNAGIDIKTAQHLLGHANIQMTLDIYTHLDSSKIDTATNAINEFLKEG